MRKSIIVMMVFAAVVLTGCKSKAELAHEKWLIEKAAQGDLNRIAEKGRQARLALEKQLASDLIFKNQQAGAEREQALALAERRHQAKLAAEYLQTKKAIELHKHTSKVALDLQKRTSEVALDLQKRTAEFLNLHGVSVAWVLALIPISFWLFRMVSGAVMRAADLKETIVKEEMKYKAFTTALDLLPTEQRTKALGHWVKRNSVPRALGHTPKGQGDAA